MTVIAISREFIRLIVEGTKVTTIRRGERAYSSGKAVMHSDEIDVTVEITNVRLKKFKDLDDADAVRDGMADLALLRSTLRRFYPSISEEDVMTIVEFYKL